MFKTQIINWTIEYEERPPQTTRHGLYDEQAPQMWGMLKMNGVTVFEKRVYSQEDPDQNAREVIEGFARKLNEGEVRLGG